MINWFYLISYDMCNICQNASMPCLRIYMLKKKNNDKYDWEESPLRQECYRRPWEGRCNLCQRGSCKNPSLPEKDTADPCNRDRNCQQQKSENIQIEQLCWEDIMSMGAGNDDRRATKRSKLAKNWKGWNYLKMSKHNIKI